MKIIFIDIETTGLDFDIHTPIEIALVCCDYENMEEIFSLESIFRIDYADLLFSDTESMQIHGITKEECDAKGAHASLITHEIINLFNKFEINKQNSVFLCQNPSFDRHFFHQIIDTSIISEMDLPYHWLDLSSMYWFAFSKTSKIESLSKDNIAKHLNLHPEEKPHRAMNGVRHLIQCYEKLYYGEILNHERHR